MKTIRIIPRLDIKGPNLVKGIHLEGLRVLGKPGNFAKFYYEQGADELLFMDVVASLYERNSLDKIISETAKSIFIPITVGGGIRDITDIRNVLRAGADKVSMNTAAIKDPSFIKKASKEFGSSTIVVAIEAIRQPDGRYFAFTDNGREFTGIEAVEWAKQVDSLGAGELIITSVDNEGTGKGFDMALLKEISDAVSIPVIAHGGAGNIDHVMEVLHDGHIDAVSVASILHYETIKHLKDAFDDQKEGNFDFILSGKAFQIFTPVILGEMKQVLHENNFNCR